jgi:molybdopterin molybdotransferase
MVVTGSTVHRVSTPPPLSWEAARQVAARAGVPLEAVATPLPLARGRRLAEPLRALVPVPGTDVSAMDGYAVAGEGPWRVVGRVLAGGDPFPAALSPGRAVEIATGAPVPEGVCAVLPYEAVVRRSGPVVAGGAEAGRHIRRRGEDCPEGVPVLAAGAVITPAVLGLAAALGHDTVVVRPAPVVSVLVTGDEVVASGLPGPGRVRDAIGPVLPGLVEWAGGRAGEPLRLADGAHRLEAALGAAGSSADVVAVCGASSRGPADHLREVLGGLGAEVLVDGVAVRPGHPQLLARLPGGPLVVGLPGNPYAALAAALTLLAPVIRALGGEVRAEGERAALAGPVRAHAADTRLVAVRRTGRGAVPVGHDRPGSLWGAALADALAAVPPGWRSGPVELVDLPH